MKSNAVSRLRPGDEIETARSAEAAESTFLKQPEDHTLPAGQVLNDQRDSAADGLAGCVFIP